MKESLRICLFAGTFLPKIGGSELSLHYLAKGFQKQGHFPVVLTLSKKGDMSLWDISYPVQRYTRFRALYLLAEKYRRPFDILYVNGIYPCGYVAARLRKILNVPIVVSCPGDDIQIIPEIGYGKRLNPKIDRRIRWTVGEVDALFAIVASFHQELQSLGASTDKLFDVPHGSDSTQFQGIPSIRTLFSIPPDCRILLLIGRNHVKKGYPDFIRAMPEIVQRYPKVRAIIVGKNTEQLLPLVNEMKVKEQVILSPPFTWNEYRRLLVGSDIYVTPSLGEGFSLALADAMAAGIPQVAFDVEGCRDVIRNNETGLIVPKQDAKALANAVVTLLENVNLYRQLSEGSRQTARSFDWDIIVDRHLEIYQRLVEIHQEKKTR